MAIRSAARWCRTYLLYCTGLTWWAKRRLRRDGSIVVLMFHRVLSAEAHAHANSLESIIVREGTFACLLGYLHRHCEVVDLNGDAPDWSGPASKPRVALTFDDGWMDNATTAFPIAREYGLPMTIFICPSLMGSNQPFWPERTLSLLKRAARSRRDGPRLAALIARIAGEESITANAIIEALKAKQPAERDPLIEELTAIVSPTLNGTAAGDPILTWEWVEKLHSTGLVSFGSHTRSHQILTQIPQDSAASELVDSKREIEDRLKSPCRLLAYPNGNVSEDVRRLMKTAGYAMAFTTECSPWTATTDPCRIPRTNMAEKGLAGPGGKFSRPLTEYTIFWRACWAALRNGEKKRREIAMTTVAAPTAIRMRGEDTQCRNSE
jgi:peptidoglycan/xylan/chitin deacetylase (PgdA/CDA1 family)